jgi:hypothetical protein
MTRLAATVISLGLVFAFSTQAADKTVRSDLAALTFPVEMAAFEATSCGQPELAAKIEATFTSLVEEAGYTIDTAKQWLLSENYRCCHGMPPKCDEADLKREVHHVESFTKTAEADIAASKKP